MSGGVMSYTVIDATSRELLSRLLQSAPDGTAVFTAQLSDDPSDTPAQHRFEVKVDHLYLNELPFMADVWDQDGHWIRLVLTDDLGPMQFEVSTP